jgi:hypothetical protein
MTPVIGVAAPGVAGAGVPRSDPGAPTACVAATLSVFSFKPRRVVEGQDTTLRAVITNCTDRSFSGSLEMFGRLVCVVMDPVATSVHLAPGSASELRMTYQAPSCTGQGEITGRLLNRRGHTVSQKVAAVTIVAPPLS